MNSINYSKIKIAKFVVILTAGGALSNPCQGGTSVNWPDVPQAVRTTILANGGTPGQAVDLEHGRKHGLAIYEAGVKDQTGNIADLDITADGELFKTKYDDAEDAAVEKGAKFKTLVAALKFTHPRDITNPFLPLATLKQDILESKNEHVERTVKPEVIKIFSISGQSVAALAVEDKEVDDGKLTEITLDYFAQDDAGNVYYLGEDVNQYKDGRIFAHDGGWLLGKETQTPGLLLPAHPQIGDKFRSEDVPNITTEVDEVVSVANNITVPAGTFQNCLKIEEHASDGATEYKYYAPAIGCIQEVDSDGNLSLQKHTTR